MLFHVSEEASIQRFEPRASDFAVEPVVWAVDEEHLRNPIEQGWLERVRQCRLYCYHLPPQTFECIDECAGYFVSRESVVPTRADVVEAPTCELQRRGVEFRVVPNLWPLRDAVVASTLQFSIIRMRNALPRSVA